MYFRGKPLYPFGFGLSYTRFRYSRLTADAPSIPAGGSIGLSVDLLNAGNRDGDEVVQLYVQFPDSKVARPRQSLKAFQRVGLKAGESKTVRLTLAARDLAYWDESAQRFVLEAGRVRLLAGSSSADIRLRKTIRVSGEFAWTPDLRQALPTK
jgi:beta-glucosidase